MVASNMHAGSWKAPFAAFYTSARSVPAFGTTGTLSSAIQDYEEFKQALAACQGTVGPLVSRLAFERMPLHPFAQTRCLWPFVKTMHNTGAILQGGTKSGEGDLLCSADAKV